MGGQGSKSKVVPNRPVPKQPTSGPTPVKMVAKPKRKMVPPDGGWGWMVLFGGCLSFFFFPSLTVAFGILFSEHILSLGSSAIGFTAIGSALSAVWSFTTLLIAPVSELFGYRRVTITGGLLAFLTLLLTAFSTSLTEFALAYSVIGGMACAFSTFIGYIIIPHYFDKRKGLANGILAAVSTLGKIAMAPLARLLLDNYGYFWACLLFGAMSLHTCVAGMLYHPPEWHKIPDPNEDVEMLEDVVGTSQTPTSIITTQHQLSHRSRKQEDDEDEDVIFVMPTTSSTTTSLQHHHHHPHHQRQDDELVLFSKENTRRLELLKEEQIMGSKASLNTSLPTLVPLEQNIFDDDDDDDDEKESCLAGCILIKPCMLLDYKILLEPHFHLIAWPSGLLLASYLNLMYSLPNLLENKGYTHYQAAFAISTYSASEVVFRLTFAFLSDFSWFPIEIAYAAGYVFSAIAVGLIPVLDSYSWILMCLGTYAAALSLTFVQTIHVIIKYIGLDRYAQMLGFLSLTNGLSIAFVGFLTGMMQNYSGNLVILFLSAIISVSAIVWVTWVAVQTSRKYRKLPEQTT